MKTTRRRRRFGSSQRGASPAPEDNPERLETLGRLRHWYRQTKNPLYAWEAIARCLINDSPPLIPDWCLDYLRPAATNLTNLSWGTDFRTRQRVKAEQAKDLVAEALLLTRRGKRN